ncbi:MAG TPA: hypothetical protein PKA95_09935 [Thermomicrobiales bacterium]|nr:hypothetical protein [Thermomicrobiales bacterium]
MATRVRVRFDGEVLRPEDPIDLRPDRTYTIVIEDAETEESAESSYPLTSIRRLATDMGDEHLAAQHDHHAHRRIDDEAHAQ